MAENKKKVWQEYTKGLLDFPSGKAAWEKEFIQAIFNNVAKGSLRKILEVGCSNGRFLKWFHREYHCEGYGVDNNATGFSTGDIIQFKVGDARNLPYQDEFFDLVFSLGLLEHFTQKEKYRILKEQNRILKRGGYLICQVPLLSFSLNFLYTKFVYDFRKGYQHFRTTEPEMKNYFKRLGLKIVLSKCTGCLFESNFFKKLTKFRFFKNLLATEILIIAKKG